MSVSLYDPHFLSSDPNPKPSNNELTYNDTQVKTLFIVNSSDRSEDANLIKLVLDQLMGKDNAPSLDSLKLKK